jgi:4-hydroxybenzoate polyprenyltransferase
MASFPETDDAGKRGEDAQERDSDAPSSGPVSTAPAAPPVIPVPPYEEEPRSEGDLVWRLLGMVKSVRPHQWVKNVFVLAPVVFAKEIFDPLLLWRASAAFMVFCLLAGAVYTMNDIADVEADRRHPVKRFRPIASGRVPIPVAKGLVVALVLGALAGAALRSWQFFAVAASYFALNVAYSLELKHVAYVDVGCIAAGFVLRVMGGGFATQIHVSYYLLACTALLALFLGFGKRRHEFALMMAGGKTRAALESYTARGLDVALVLTALATIATYLAYTLDPHTRAFFKTEWLWVSTLNVALGVARFVYLVRTRARAESPTQEMLRDGPFVAIVLIWVALVMWVVYQLRPS